MWCLWWKYGSCSGCTDSSAFNYDSSALIDDGSCESTPFGDVPDTDCMLLY